MQNTNNETPSGEIFHVHDAAFQDYRAVLKDKYRPPSKGGNTKAWHQHVVIIEGHRYAFLALGARKWAYKGDTISFDWSWDSSKKYRNVEPNSIVVRDRTGAPVTRGERGHKKWRTAVTRLPGRRREWKD